jgi:D-alanyl-D-alanine dipeptidase
MNLAASTGRGDSDRSGDQDRPRGSQMSRTIAGGELLTRQDKKARDATGRDEDSTSLRPVVGVRPVLQYHLSDAPGAASLPFVAGFVLKQLREASDSLARRGDGTELILLDAHRTRELQAWVTQETVLRLEGIRPELSDEQRSRLACELVGDPNGTFPHGTGGAVAVTLAREGKIVDMGTAFGDIEERSGQDYFEQQPGGEEATRFAHERRTLHEVMIEAGFWSHDRLWWHYELGTERWALRLPGAVRDVRLNDVVPALDVEGPAARPPTVPARYSFLQAGVGQPFLSVQEGDDARVSGGHYYVRHSHPGGDALSGFLAREVFGATSVVLTVSGHAAVLHAVRVLAEDAIGLPACDEQEEGRDEAAEPPPGDHLGEYDEADKSCAHNDENDAGREAGEIGTDGETVAKAQQKSDCCVPRRAKLLIAKDVYQGSKATLLKWGHSKHADPRLEVKFVDRERMLSEVDETVDIVYVDSPSNWHVECHDLLALSEKAHQFGAKLIVDVTLQPCQDALAAGADLLVCSLSKDVSLGHTMAGAIAGDELEVLGRVRSLMLDWGELITAETAHTIHQHAFSLRDRLHAQTMKVAAIKQALERHSAVTKVHTVEPSTCCNFSGSQLTFELLDPDHGTRLERIVGQRALDPSACLHLARTFGAVFTTLEHLASRGKSNGKPKIPRGMVRLGLGCESADRILAELMFALDASVGQAPAPIDVGRSERILDRPLGPSDQQNGSLKPQSVGDAGS